MSRAERSTKSRPCGSLTRPPNTRCNLLIVAFLGVMRGKRGGGAPYQRFAVTASGALVRRFGPNNPLPRALRLPWRALRINVGLWPKTRGLFERSEKPRSRCLDFARRSPSSSLGETVHFPVWDRSVALAALGKQRSDQQIGRAHV